MSAIFQRKAIDPCAKFVKHSRDYAPWRPLSLSRLTQIAIHAAPTARFARAVHSVTAPLTARGVAWSLALAVVAPLPLLSSARTAVSRHR